MPKRLFTGRVKSDKMAKTRVVEIARLVRHPKYKKFFRDRTTCYVHDEDNLSSEGDLVQIVESRPMSKTKRWNLVNVVEKSQEVDVVAMRAARRQADIEAAEAAKLSAEKEAGALNEATENSQEPV